MGLILLLLGHVLTTTLVDRADPSHLVTLEKDTPVEFKEYELTFRDTVLWDEEDPEYNYKIGEGFAGFVIEVTKDGEKVDEVTPGILRFNFATTRSEVDRMVRQRGVMILIDAQQQAEMRATVLDLRGSHLVWVGWGLFMLGGRAALLSSSPVASEEEE